MKAYRTISGVLLTDIWMIYKYENKFQLRPKFKWRELVYAVIFKIKFVTMFLEQRYNLNVAWVFVFMVSGLSSVVTPGGFAYESGADDRPVP